MFEVLEHRTSNLELRTVVRPPPPTMMDVLAPYRVLDLTNELGWLCGRILSDLGADVVKVEPPAGDLGRTQPPLIGSIGTHWLAFNAGKRGITLNIESPRGGELFLRLVDTSQFVIESYTPGYLDTLGLGWRTLSARNPRLILTSITPYGQKGPDALAPASDLELMAASGAAWLAGDPDRPPVRISQPQAPLWAAMQAAMGTLIAHHFRQRTGQGQHVDAAAQAGVVPALSHAPTFWDMLQENPRRSGPFLSGRSVSGAPIRNIWPCKDGFVAFAIYGGDAGRHTNRQLTAWMASRNMAPDFMLQLDWDRFDVATIPPEEVHELEEAIGPFFLALTRLEFFQGVIGRRMLGYPVATAEDISRDEQLQARDVWQDVFDPCLDRSLRYPSGFARFDGDLTRIQRPAPALGEHNLEIFSSELGLTEEQINDLSGAGAL